MAKKRRRRPPPPDSPDPDDRARFPFGETQDSGSDGDLFGDSGEDLESSDLDSGSGLFDESESVAAGHSATGFRKLPNVPPGGSPADDASFDSIDAHDSEYDEYDDDSDVGPSSIESAIGPVNASGPLVIVDDEEDLGEASSRYKASVVDDSARLAGAAASKRQKRGRKRTGQRSWREEAVDPDDDVPTLSTRRPRPAPKPSRAPLVVVILLSLVALGGLGAGLEMKRRQDLKALEAQHAQALDALRKDLTEEKDAAVRSEQDAGQQALDSAAQRAKTEREAIEAQARTDLARAREQATADAEQATQAAVQAERKRAEKAAREAIEVELAQAREARAEETEEKIAQAVEEERERGREQIEEVKQKDEEKRLRDLENLRRELEAELAASATREEEEAMAKAFEDDRDAILDEVEGDGGGGGGEDVDDWDSYFDDDGGGGGDGGSEDDPFADVSGDGEDGESLHPIQMAWNFIKENVHGSVGYKNLSHFNRGPNHDLRKTRHEFRAKLEYRGWLFANDDMSTGLRLVAIADIRLDDDKFAVTHMKGIDEEERRRPIVLPEELYLGLSIDFLEVRGGYQIFAWGTGDLLNPTDNINPIDYSDLFDSRRMSVFSVLVALDFGMVSVEGIAIPTFTRSRLPIRNRRFDVLSQSPIPIFEPDDPDPSGQNTQWAGRAVAHIGGFDFSVSGYSGFNDLPSPRLVFLSLLPPVGVIRPEFDRTHVAGFDFATTLGIFGAEGGLGEVLNGIQVHGEAAHFWTEGPGNDDYVQYVFGFNYQFVDIILEHDLTVVIEYAGDFETKTEAQQVNQVRIDRALRGAWLARLAYAVDDDLSFEMTAAVITYGPDNGLVHPAVVYNVTDNLELTLSGDIFFGDEQSFFGQFRRDGRVIFEAKASF